MRKRIALTAALAVTIAGSLSLAGTARATPARAAAISAAEAPQVYVAKSSDTFQDVVINPTSKTAYLTVPSQNQVDVLNLKKGTFAKPIPVGSDPLGIDITPDGKTLYVCDGGGQAISQVDLATRKVTTITTPPGPLSDRPFSIVVLNNGHALFSTTFSGSGFGADVYDLNLSTDAISVAPGFGFGGLVTEDTPLSRSADHATAAAVLGDDSGGPFDTYTAATGNVVSGSLNTFIASSALSGDGSTLLIDGTYVIDPATGSLLGTIGGPGGSSVLSASGTTGYALAGSTITKLNITRFTTGPVISLPESASGGAELAMSPDGHYLVAETTGGATIVRF